MASRKEAPVESGPMKALRKFAMTLPDAEEGTSCVNRAFRVGKKAYAYLGMKGDQYKLMIKLTDSLAKAEALHAKRPDNYQPGKLGWVTVWLPLQEKAPKGLLEGWIEESYRALVPTASVDKLRKRRGR